MESQALNIGDPIARTLLELAQSFEPNSPAQQTTLNEVIRRLARLNQGILEQQALKKMANEVADQVGLKDEARNRFLKSVESVSRGVPNAPVGPHAGVGGYSITPERARSLTQSLPPTSGNEVPEDAIPDPRFIKTDASHSDSEKKAEVPAAMVD